MNLPGAYLLHGILVAAWSRLASLRLSWLAPPPLVSSRPAADRGRAAGAVVRAVSLAGGAWRRATGFPPVPSSLAHAPGFERAGPARSPLGRPPAGGVTHNAAFGLFAGRRGGLRPRPPLPPPPRWRAGPMRRRLRVAAWRGAPGLRRHPGIQSLQPCREPVWRHPGTSMGALPVLGPPLGLPPAGPPVRRPRGDGRRRSTSRAGWGNTVPPPPSCAFSAALARPPKARPGAGSPGSHRPTCRRRRRARRQGGGRDRPPLIAARPAGGGPVTSPPVPPGVPSRC
jgi:hypothetical protein